MVASTQMYRISDLMPIHPACDCGVSPISEAEFRGAVRGGNGALVLRPELLEQVHGAVEANGLTPDRGARNPDYRELVTVHEHGELGPVLSRTEHWFTGSADLGKGGVPVVTVRTTGAKVPGMLRTPEGVLVQPHELDTAKRLTSAGHDVEFRMVTNANGVKNPDILLDGEIWEMKSPTGAGKNTIDNNLRLASQQSPRVVLDLGRTPLTDEAAVLEVRRVFALRTRLESVIVIRKDGRQIRLDRP